jgi:RND family efflux transporter MFP subunit
MSDPQENALPGQDCSACRLSQHSQCARSFARRTAAFALVAMVSVIHAACERAPSSGSSGQDGSSPAPAADPIAVEVVSPAERDVPRTIRVTGTLYGDEEATIAAKVSGRIVEIMKDMGDTASPGEALLRIDPTDYVLERDERARAQSESLARLGLPEMPGEGFDINALPSVERARLQAANAKARFERGRQLAEREPPLISQQDYADLETTWEVAESNLDVERLTAEAVLAEARTLEAQLRIAAQRVEDTLHRAPTGPGSDTVYEVARRRVSIGDFVSVGAPLFHIVDPDPVKLRASVPEARLSAVRIGQRTLLRVEAYEREFEGRVSRISPAVDAETRTFIVEVEVDNAEALLKPGSFATAEIEIGTERALVVPAGAVVTFAGVHKVVLVEDGAAKEQIVTLGQRLGDDVEVRSGVQAGQTLVLRPTGAIVTGVPLRVPAEGAAP